MELFTIYRELGFYSQYSLTFQANYFNKNISLKVILCLLVPRLIKVTDRCMLFKKHVYHRYLV